MTTNNRPNLVSVTKIERCKRYKTSVIGPDKTYDLYQKIVRLKAIRHSRAMPGLEMDDLIQESFLLIAKKLQWQQNNEAENIDKELIQEIENTMSRIKYAHKKVLNESRLLAHHELQGCVYPDETQAEADERRTVIERGISHLKPKQRVVIESLFGIGCAPTNHLNLAEVEGISSQAIRKREKRALKDLSKMPNMRQIYSDDI
jgi:RNA polymerase sigma factor (sigma-70 family)